MKRLFFFSEFFYPVENSTGAYLTQIIQHAAQVSGVPVTVICSTPLNEGEKEELPFDVVRISCPPFD